MARTSQPLRSGSPSTMDSSDGQDFVVLDDKDIDDYNEDGILPLSPEVLADIQKWLQPTDYLADSSEYNKHLSSHVPGTGLWIQETEAYRLWHDSPDHGSLWTKAIAGAGKSVFAAMIAAKLAEDETVPVVSFFFRQIIATNHDPQSLVRDWISMILKHSPPLQAKMKKYMDDRRTLDNITTNEFWQDVVQALVSLPKVYCIVDALDEMDIDKQDFFRNLVSLGRQKSSSIKLLMTSRPLPRIEAFLKDPSILQVRLEQLKVDKDIALYVDYRLNRQSGMNLELRSAVKQTIGLKAQGSFLYARLMMDELLDHMKQMIPDIKYIQRSLDWLPLTLEDMYNGMLLDHSLRSRVPQDLQLTILQWVTHSSRPLRLLELAAMLDSQSPSGKATKDTKAVVRAACGPLLEILEDETVSVIHHSFTEFLIDSERSKRPSSDDLHPQFPVIDSQRAHRAMGLACLKYLSSGCLNDWKMEERSDHEYFYRPRMQTQQGIKMLHSFLDYAMYNWYVHIRKVGLLDEQLLAGLDDFMSTGNPSFCAWVNMVWPTTSNLSKISPLHVSSWAGIPTYVEHILKRGDESNGRDNKERTPLSWASAKGHTDVVRLLLEKIEDPDVDDYDGLKPLHYAAMGNHHPIVKLLLAAGVSPLTGKMRDPGRFCGNAPSSIGESPLLYASRSGSVESVQAMVPYLELKDLHNALCWASSSGKIQIVDLILALPNVSAEPPEHSDTPLFLASGDLHYQVMKTLLEKGADPNKTSTNYGHMEMMSVYDMAKSKDRGPTPLHAVCRINGTRNYSREQDTENMIRCFRLLLDAGSKIDAIDKSGSTALHHAIGHGSHIQPDQALVSLLLHNGADPTVQNDFGDTPLHLVSLTHDSAFVIKTLLAKGASLDVRRSKDGKTPLHTMMDNVQTLDIKPLVPHVKDWNIRDSHGDTPLHIYLSKSFSPAAALQDLLDAGADLNCKNKAGEAPIHSIKETYHAGKSVLPSLIAAGASLETRDSDGRTFLLRLLQGNLYNAQGSLKHLLDLGAKIDACDNNGDSVLHLVCRRNRDPDLVQTLVAAGANQLSTNHSGNTLLHEILAGYSIGQIEHTIRLIDIFLDAGIPAGARNNFGQTPFHLACNSCPPQNLGSSKADPLEEILKTKFVAFVNAEDNHGIRPIHQAAAKSEELVARLILHGADATAVTNDDMTILHIAARARQSNIIGFLLDHFSKLGRTDMLDMKDKTGRTALHYACRSGRPESVALLLRAGASPNTLDKQNNSPLHACAEFEHDRRQRTTDIERPDPLRPSQQEIPYHMRHQHRQALSGNVSTEDGTTRIRDIVRLLLDHGAAVATESNSSGFSRVSLPIQTAVAEGCAEMVDELMPHMEAYNAASNKKQGFAYWSTSHRMPFQERYLLNATKPDISKDDFKDGDATRLCNHLLALGQHKAIEELPAMGADFSPRVGHQNDFLTVLAQLGYVSTFEKLGLSVQKPGWINGIVHPTHKVHELVRPYLITAAQRELPNLDMIKLIVEKFGADVNIQPVTSVYQSGGGYKYPPDESALHVLVRGCHWWQTEAIEYLLSKGANTEAKNQNGRTPLNLAVSNDHCYGTYRRRETAKILLEHGANPNSMDDNGLTCLNKAMHDIELIRLLIKHGADISLGDQPILFSAITAMNVAAVAVILESGADCNSQPNPIDRSKLPRHEQDIRPHDLELYPLHYAASHKFNNPKTRDSAINIVKLLLHNGADPYLNSSDDSIIIHDIIKSGGILQPFLELPDLKLEYRDQKGRTLLLAASKSNGGTNSLSSSSETTNTTFKSHEDRAKEHQRLTASDPSLCRTIYDMGGDLTATDNEGNNALHLLLEGSPHNNEEFKKTFRIFVEKAPTLVSQKNTQGNTPFHLAISHNQMWSAETLMGAGADPLDKDGKGNTPLHYFAPSLCSFIADTEAIPRFKKYLDLRLDINEKNNVGETPVFKYFGGRYESWEGGKHGHRKHYTPLEDAGADLFVTNNDGETLLHLVAKQANNGSMNHIYKSDTVDTFKFLMEKGLDPMTEDKNQRTALDVAAACSNHAVLALFQRNKTQTMPSKNEESDSEERLAKYS